MMTTFISILLGIPIGVGASLLAWWILFHCVTPQIKFSHDISKTKSRNSKTGYRWRVKIQNAGKRDIYDVEVFARYKAGGLNSTAPQIDTYVDLELSKTRIPKIEIDNAKHIRIFPEETEIFNKFSCAESILGKLKEKSLTLEEMFSIGSNGTMQLIVFGHDSFSGTKKFFESKLYTVKDIKHGNFVKKELIVAAE